MTLSHFSEGYRFYSMLSCDENFFANLVLLYPKNSFRIITLQFSLDVILHSPSFKTMSQKRNNNKKKTDVFLPNIQ